MEDYSANPGHRDARLEGQQVGGVALTPNRLTALVVGLIMVFIGLALGAGVLVGRALSPGSMAGSDESRPVAEPESAVVPWQPRVDSSGAMVPIQPAVQGVVASPAGVEPRVGDLAVDFVLSGLSEDEIQLSAFRGQPVLINFWATWCYWCRFEMPALQAAYEKYRDQGFVVIGVNVQEPRSLVQDYVRHYGLTFPVALDTTGEVADQYRVRGLPTTYLVDRKGVIVRVHQGAIREDDLQRYIRQLLRE